MSRDFFKVRASDLRTPSEWAVVFSIMGLIGTGLVLYERNEVTPSSSIVAMEMVPMDTKEQVSSEPSVHSEDSGIQSDWIRIEKTWHPQVILSNSFDLLSEEPVPIHEPCLLYTSPSPRDATLSRMPSSA